mgnify:FL=1
MKLFVQIPCLNEESTIEKTIKNIPKNISGVDEIEILIIDDGCTDKTIKIAESCGVNHFVIHERTLGLASAFRNGVAYCLKNGADIIVNTDGDNQYDGECIEDLVIPIINKKYDIVIGARPIDEIDSFSTKKKLLQKLGSYVVRLVSNTKVRDATSGFRALSKHAAEKIRIIDDYTYTLDMIISCGRKNMNILSVPINVNPPTRESRLIESTFDYVSKSMKTIFRIFVIYSPLRFFMIVGSLFSSFGIILCIRWLVLFFIFEHSRTHMPSLVLASITLSIGFLFYGIGILSDLISVNRELMQEIRDNQKKQSF